MVITTDSPKLQRPTIITTTLGYKDDNKDASANSVVDTTAGQIDRNYLPDPSVNELPEGKSATSIKFNTHFPAAFGKNSSITAQIIASTSADPNKVFLQKNDKPTIYLNKDAVLFRPMLKIHLTSWRWLQRTVSNNR